MTTHNTFSVNSGLEANDVQSKRAETPSMKLRSAKLSKALIETEKTLRRTMQEMTVPDYTPLRSKKPESAVKLKTDDIIRAYVQPGPVTQTPLEMTMLA